jgi:hypothetical protein
MLTKAILIAACAVTTALASPVLARTGSRGYTYDPSTGTYVQRQPRAYSGTRYWSPYAGYGDGYRAYGYWPGQGNDNWSHWSPSYHPGWPCVSGGRGTTGKSAYPSWEVGRGCR